MTSKLLPTQSVSLSSSDVMPNGGWFLHLGVSLHHVIGEGLHVWVGPIGSLSHEEFQVELRATSADLFTSSAYMYVI